MSLSACRIADKCVGIGNRRVKKEVNLLPDVDPQTVRTIHLIPWPYTECLIEFGYVDHGSIDPLLCGGMYVRQQLCNKHFFSLLIHPGIRIAQKITLKGREASDGLSFFVCVGELKGIQSKKQAAQIGDVLTLCGVSIDMKGIYGAEFGE